MRPTTRAKYFFHMPMFSVENPAFPTSYYGLARVTLIGGVYQACDRDSIEKINASSQSSVMGRGKCP